MALPYENIYRILSIFYKFHQPSPQIKHDGIIESHRGRKKKEEKGMICDYGSGKVCSDMAARPTRNGNVLGRM